MEKKYVEVSDQEIRIHFTLGCKCRTNITLKSLNQTTPIAFKVQTSSPHKFLVNPPNGLIPPSSSTTFQVILKPQSNLPSSFPRSPSDRFLIKTALAANANIHQQHQPDLSSFFSTTTITQDIKLKVFYMGRLLLQHAVAAGRVDAVKLMLKRDKSVVADLTPCSSMSLLEAASASGDVKMLTLLLEAGLRVDGSDPAQIIRPESKSDLDKKEFREALTIQQGAEKGGKGTHNGLSRVIASADKQMPNVLMDVGYADPTPWTNDGLSPLTNVARAKGHKELVEVLEKGEMVLTAARRGDFKLLESLLSKGVSIKHCDQYGLSALHVASIKGHINIVATLIEHGMELDCQDVEGHTPLHLAVEGGNVEIVALLIGRGANINARSKRGATPLYIATSMGYESIAQILRSKGATSTSTLPSSSSSLSSSSLN